MIQIQMMVTTETPSLGLLSSRRASAGLRLVSDIQTASFSCGRKSPAVGIDEMDGGGETEMREVKEVPDQLETIGMELQQAEGVIGQSTASGT